MPTDRARKQHIRDHQQPGESYTAALRRLQAVTWEPDGGGMGSTEYRGTVDGTELVVSFAGDHKRPWYGYWDVLDADLEECLVGGRYRFTSPQPDEAAIAAALAQIGDIMRRVAAGDKNPDTVDTSHGPAVTGELADRGCYFVRFSDEEWLVTQVEDMRDDLGDGEMGDGGWRLDGPAGAPSFVTWDQAAGCWRTEDGDAVDVFEL